MARTAALSFRIPESIKSAIEKAARDDERSVSTMVERILRAWLIERGYLTKE